MFRLVALTLAVQFATAKIVDYSHDDYILVENGKAAIYSEYGSLYHVTNLSFYREIIDTLEERLKLRVDDESRQAVEADMVHIRTQLSELMGLGGMPLSGHSRSARALDVLGSIWKWLAGSPDHEDWTDLTNKVNQLIDNNEQQLRINSGLSEQIKLLTERIGRDRDSRQGALSYELINQRNRMTILELNELQSTINLARANILNSLIFNRQDINAIVDSELQELVVLDILNESKFRILQRREIIVVAIKYPAVQKICRIYQLWPVQHNGRTLVLEADQVALCPDQSYYKVYDCHQQLSHAYCQLSENSTCITELLNRRKAKCQTIDSRRPKFVDLRDGIFVVNEARALVTEDGRDAITVNGTFLIAYETMVEVNATKYYNEANMMLAETVANDPVTVEFLEHIKVKPTLSESLKSMDAQDFENIKHISRMKPEDVRSSYEFNLLSWVPSGGVVVLVLVVLFLLRW